MKKIIIISSIVLVVGIGTFVVLSHSKKEKDRKKKEAEDKGASDKLVSSSPRVADADFNFTNNFGRGGKVY